MKPQKKKRKKSKKKTPLLPSSDFIHTLTLQILEAHVMQSVKKLKLKRDSLLQEDNDPKTYLNIHHRLLKKNAS